MPDNKKSKIIRSLTFEHNTILTFVLSLDFFLAKNKFFYLLFHDGSMFFQFFF